MPDQDLIQQQVDQLQQSSQTPSPPRKVVAGQGSNKGCATGCGCALLLGLSIFLFGAGIMYVTSVLVEESWFLSGDPNNFDPIAALPAIREHAGSGAQLVSFDAYYVRSDGTMNLNADYSPSPSVDYRFYRPLDQAPANAPPIGAGANTAGQWYEPVDVDVARPWTMWNVTTGNSKYQYFNLGMDREPGSPVSSPPGSPAPDPTCTLAELWQVALRNDAPPNAVATINYDADGYRFYINGTNVNIDFAQDCKPR